MTRIADLETRLMARLSELLAREDAIEAELDSHRETDWPDLATQREEDEVLEGLGLSAQAEVRRIRAALNRIKQGTYGICVTCGAEIEAARLEALPWTPFCRDCAK